MRGKSGARGRAGTALAAALSILAIAAPAAAEETPTGASDDAEITLEVIVSEPVAPGAAPRFDVIETDLDGLSELIDAVDDERIEWNGTAELTLRPDDPGFAHGAAAERESLEAAWDTTLGSPDIVIAVLDTGVAPGPEFGDRLLPGASVIDGDPHVDTFGHGTAVAKVAAAAHNGVEAAGVCPNCRVLPVQVADANGSVGWAAAAEGIVWAVDEGADVVNLSFGGRSAPTIVHEAVAYAIANDVVLVASAGNYGDDERFYPAAIDGVISVGAHDDQFGRFGWSSHGDWVDVAGPGCLHDIHGPATLGCGTSFSSPWISGVVGLLLAEKGPTDPGTVEQLIESTTTPLSWVETGWVAPDSLFGRRFADVDTAAYYAEPVAWLVDNDITTGTSPTTYSPHAPVTRAQLATFLYRLSAGQDSAGQDSAGQDSAGQDSAADATFTDVDTAAYYAQPVAWLVDNDITTGTSPTTYSPHAPVTRAQLATFLYRLSAGQDSAGQDSAASTAADATFTDVDTAAYYAQPVAWLVDNDITTGTSPTTYSPHAPVTRAQLATFLYRLSADEETPN